MSNVPPTGSDEFVPLEYRAPVEGGVADECPNRWQHAPHLFSEREARCIYCSHPSPSPAVPDEPAERRMEPCYRGGFCSTPEHWPIGMRPTPPVVEPERCERDGSFLIGGMAVTRQDYLALTDALGFGDDRTEPAARPEQLLDPIEQAFHEANEHRECPVLCEDCGETLAATTCPDCHGSGCSPLTALGAYDPCERCAGATKVHEGCVGKSYADLAALAAPPPVVESPDEEARLAEVIRDRFRGGEIQTIARAVLAAGYRKVDE